MIPVVEVTLSWLFKNARGRDEKCFFKSPAFADHPEQTITVTSPDCGPANTTLTTDYTQDGIGRIPTLEWAAPDSIKGSVKEWLVVNEDPDAPLPTPICHGLYAGIPPHKTRLDPSDFAVQDDEGQSLLLKGGFYYGKNRRGTVYIPPRPLLNHGPHRYFFEVIALSEPLDKELLKTRPTREQIAEAIQGKVLGWGMWVGVAERKWS
ncbi:PEBP-like protein [Diplogelasinospora grovesii]|uniref:PEBP-like protein n=1 Tax=Diplogelasinospora grovesii TaxID=303347 RepID=A0AAN6NDD3_9PEZI|nr:PEBP-like protein [Diplogelasinospora grovesii]